MPSESLINSIIGLCEAFGRTASKATIGAYAIGLSGLTDVQVEQAAALALQRCKFMPVPAELRELAATSGESFESMAAKAFTTLGDTIRSTGSDYSVNFADGAINAAVRLLGGWKRVCEMPREEFDKWYRKDFLATYIGVCRHGASPDLCRYHGGELERLNARWDGQVNPRSGHVYHLEQYGAGVQTIGASYLPALPAPPVDRKRIGGVGEFLKLSADGKLISSSPPAPEPHDA